MILSQGTKIPHAVEQLSPCATTRDREIRIMRICEISHMKQQRSPRLQLRPKVAKKKKKKPSLECRRGVQKG